jgi:hypothetical protein
MFSEDKPDRDHHIADIEFPSFKDSDFPFKKGKASFLLVYWPARAFR